MGRGFLAGGLRPTVSRRQRRGRLGPGCFRQFGCLLTATALLLNGCAADKSILGPKHPLTSISTTPLRDDLVRSEDIATWKKAYDDATVDDDRKYYRNRIARQLMLVTDQYYLAWSQQLFGARAIGSTVADIASGVLSAFAAASGASAARTLALVLTGISTTRLSVEKNLLLEQTSGALMAQMDNDRAKVSIQIGQYLQQNTTDYPLEEMLRDILRYYKAGTLASAGESLQAAAVQAREVTQAAVEKDKGDQVVAPAVLARAPLTQLSTKTPDPALDRPVGSSSRPATIPVHERPDVRPDRPLSSARTNPGLEVRKRLLARWVASRVEAGDVRAMRDCARALRIKPLPADTSLAYAISTRISRADTGAKVTAIETASGLPAGEPVASVGPTPVTATDR